MHISEIKNKKISVIGAARSGIAVALLLQKQGGEILVSDSSVPGNAEEIQSELDKHKILLELGGHTVKTLECDWLVVSPGVPVNSTLVQEALQKNISVFGELEVASWFSRAPIAAITGSNGKSTTSALLADMVNKAGRPCVLAGNIGESFAGLVAETTADGVAVLEVSSFQLETIKTFHPSVAVLLNLTPDHLDRHGTMEEYGRLKARIFENQTEKDVIIYNGNDARVKKLVGEGAGEKWPFGIETESNCGFVREESLILKIDGVETILVAAEQMKLKGEHNYLNGIAAALTAAALKIDMNAVRSSLRNYSGLSHRMEFIKTIDGVDWVNDSKATNVDAVWFALSGYDNPIVLIAGGRDKDSDFTLLRERTAEKVRTLILIGEAAEKIGRALENETQVLFAESLQDAVDKAKAAAKKGDTVLLSPACASFDMFKNFEDRGDRFKQLVMEQTYAV